MNIVVPPNLNVQCFVGGPASGKTASLIACAQALAETESSTGRFPIGFICATEPAAEYVRKKVPSNVAVGTAQDFALEILRAEGMRSHVLSAYEEQFLFEDLRTTGLPQKPLRRILNYLYESMESLHVWDENWIEMREERLVYNTLMDNLRFTGGICAPEVAVLAATTLANNAQAQQTYGFPHILVDDYHLHSRAFQLLCNLLSHNSLTIASCESTHTPIQKQYANPNGLEELLQNYENPAIEKLAGVPFPITAEHISTPQVANEFDEIISHVRAHLEQSETQSSIAVVATQNTWLKNFRSALAKKDISFAEAPRQIRILSFTDEDACRRVAQDAQNILDSNAYDGVALRTLFGLGDHLARSAALKRIREQYPERTFAELHAENPLETIMQSVQTYAGTEKCSSQSQAPSLHASDSGVFIGRPQDLLGRTFDFVIFGGCVEGWLPARAYFEAVGNTKEQLLARSISDVEYAKQATRKKLVFTSFEECSLEFAERLDLHYEHIHLKNGVRTCELHAPKLLSQFLQE